MRTKLGFAILGMLALFVAAPFLSFVIAAVLARLMGVVAASPAALAPR